ncbi:MAG TPA: T9SS type A sorting domain-containing protein [Bacteroidia bacterium]|jgi:hypothetical protein|nr:T9SS type A sorting domain-containing protein [Bacteroidia bacterium]
MKNITFLSGLALFAGLSVFTVRASGQITIDQTDMPSVGLTVITDSDGTSKPSPGLKSASAQYWDFSTLKKQQAKTVEFMAPSSTPYASTFSTANLADSTLGGNGYTFFDITSSNFSATGAEEIVVANSTPFLVEINLNPYFEQSALPATYGSIVPPSVASGMEQFAVTFSVIVTGERFYDSITYNDTVDAWGTMKMPNGQTYDVLRQKHNEVDYEDVYLAYFNVFQTTPYERIISKKYEYNWYAKGIGYILVEMDMDSTSSTIKDIIWDTTAPPPVTTAINEMRSSGRNINAYPNPCSSQISFSSADKTEQYLAVYDVAGRKIETTEMKNGLAMLNTASYSNGVYLYVLTDTSGNITGRGKFSVSK